MTIPATRMSSSLRSLLDPSIESVPTVAFSLLFFLRLSFTLAEMGHPTPPLPHSMGSVHSMAPPLVMALHTPMYGSMPKTTYGAMYGVMYGLSGAQPMKPHGAQSPSPRKSPKSASIPAMTFRSCDNGPIPSTHSWAQWASPMGTAIRPQKGRSEKRPSRRTTRPM